MPGPSSSPTTSVGARLKEARTARSWTVARAAQATKLHPDVIVKLEENRIEELPSLAYAKGFVRIYARALGLDHLPLLKMMEGSVDEDLELADLRPEALEALPVRTREARVGAEGMGFFVILGVVGLVLILAAVQLYRVWPSVFGDTPATLEELAIPVAETEEEKKAQPSLSELEAEVRRATPVRPEVVAKAEEVRKAEPVEPVLPAQVVTPVEPAETPASAAVPEPVWPHSLQLFAYTDCWAQIIAVRAGQETPVFAGNLPVGVPMPADTEAAWKADSFIITLSDTLAVDIIFNGQNRGKYHLPGRQKFILQTRPVQ